MGKKNFDKEEKEKYKITKAVKKQMKKGKFYGDEISESQNLFIKENKNKLDNLTNNSIRKNPEDRQLFLKAISLGYLPKNVQIKK